MKTSACRPPAAPRTKSATAPTQSSVELTLHVDGALVRFDGASLTAPACPATRKEIAFKLRYLANVLEARA